VNNTGEMRFDGRVAIVTGAGNGLGRAYARLLGARGAKVVVNDNGADIRGQGQGEGPARTVAKEIADSGGEAVADTHSVADPKAGEAIVQTALDAFGRVDILVNNAGIGTSLPFADASPEYVRNIFDVDLTGLISLSQAAWAPMVQSRYGRIVNVTSGVIFGEANFSIYIAAKAGVFGFSRALAIEGAPLNIKCNSLAPHAGTRATAVFRDEAYREQWSRLTPDLVAPAVALLAHEDCPVTGQCIDAGGGLFSMNFLAQTEGFHDPAPTMELLRDHFDQVMDTKTHRIFAAFPEFSEYFTARTNV